MHPGYAHCSAISHPGLVRARNEDAIAVSTTSDLPLNRWSGSLPLHGGWALVADGIGGNAAGDVASRLALELMKPVMPLLTDQRAIEQGLAAVNDALFDAMDRHPSLKGMGTTIAGVILLNDQALVFNVGDSRVYLHHMGELALISADDVVEDNLLTQCLGGSGGRADCKPHIRSVRLQAGSTLLLCTDGLTDMVADQQVEAILGAEGSVCAPVLLQAALDAGGIDNVSAVAISFSNFGA